MTHYTFQYRVIGTDDWKQKARTWKTMAGAKSAADTWCVDMLANGCDVVVRVGKVVDNRFQPIE